jgi:hypothetical protein
VLGSADKGRLTRADMGNYSVLPDMLIRYQFTREGPGRRNVLWLGGSDKKGDETFESMKGNGPRLPCYLLNFVSM